MWASRVLLSSTLLLACGPLFAEEDEEQAADMEFLEYLGYWEQSDEEWLMLEAPIAAELDERSDPVPEGEESTETEDES